MICPRCGEKNPDNYRYCGMCGDTLQGPTPPPTATTKVVDDTSAARTTTARPEGMAFSRMEDRGSSKAGTIVADDSRVGSRAPHQEPVQPIAGPSLLGLNVPAADSIRETTFRGMTTYYPEERGVAWGRIFLTVIFIAGLVAVGWWRYKNYGIPGTGKPPSWLSAMNRTTPPSDNANSDFGHGKAADQSGNQNSDQNKSDQNQADQRANQVNDQNKSAAPVGVTDQTSQTGAPASPVDQKNAGTDMSAGTKAADTATPAPDKSASAESGNQSDEAASATEDSAPQKPAKAAKSARTAASSAAAKPSAAVAQSDGDALFRKGTAYLYGQGVVKNCDQAIRYLKSASAQNNAKARSTFGTMYATGHCVPRDLPSSYRWFALALQADPGNSILEKDLTAVWNQMTTPERQLAMKIKPGE